MIILECEQRSEEWTAARLGIPTASSFDKIVTSKGEPSKQAYKYMCQLAGERVSGYAEESFSNKIMDRGIEREVEAIQFYELTRDCIIQKVGVCYPDDLKKYACSPDGLVGQDGMVEFKCPTVPIHVGYLLDNCLPTDYFQQVQGQLLVTGRTWCDFVSYYPGLRPLMIRVERDEKFLKALKTELDNFCKALDEMVSKIR